MGAAVVTGANVVPFETGETTDKLVVPEAVTGDTTTAVDDVKMVPLETVTTGTLVVLSDAVTGETKNEEVHVEPGLLNVMVEYTGPAVEDATVPFDVATGETTDKLVVPEAVTGETTTAVEEVKRVPFETVTTGTTVVLSDAVTGETKKEETHV